MNSAEQKASLKVGLAYDKIAKTYDADYASILSQSRALWVNQLKKHLKSPVGSVLDFCLGTGQSFLLLNEIISVHNFVGNDISQEMLNIAKEMLPFPIKELNVDALILDKCLPESSQDLILCHFLFGHCDSHRLIKNAYTLLKPGAYFSVVTSTKQQGSYIYRDKYPFLDRLLGVSSAVSSSHTPDSHESNLQDLKCAGFEIVEEVHFRPVVVLPGSKDAWACAYETGWLVDWFSTCYYIKIVWAKALMLMLKAIGGFPLTANFDISIVLARKP